jgi:prepilin-type N-terminal cleavage/methylation domain-containing protein
MLRRLRVIINNQKGFALIEMIVVVAIIGLISGAVAGTISQVFIVNAQSTARMTAVKQVESAIHWISRDAMMAQTINVTAGFPQTGNLSLYWVGWDNKAHSANYSLENGQLRRIYSDGSRITNTLVAEHINTDTGMTECSSDNDTGVVTFNFKLTASVSGFRQASETRVVEVIPRPGL